MKSGGMDSTLPPKKIYNHVNTESTKVPICVPVSPSNAVKCYPCREVSLNYSELRHFHGGDTGSTPVRDAKFLNIFKI